MPANRKQDESLLDLVKARASGMSLEQIAKRFRRASAPITSLTNKVMDADMAESKTEKPEDIAAAYWPRVKRKKNA